MSCEGHHPPQRASPPCIRYARTAGHPRQSEDILDGTFKVVKKPFTQLFTVHCFVKKDEHVKQVPVLYALMSGKKMSDYKAVLKALKAALTGDIRVQEGMLDFETRLSGQQWHPFSPRLVFEH